MAGDVADDEHERAPFDREGVVPVAADVDDHVGGAVDGGELDAFDHRQPLRHDRLLEHLDHVVLRRELLLAQLPELGPLEGGGGAAAEIDGELEVGVAEGHGPVVADDDDTAGPARHLHRDDDARHGPERFDERARLVVERSRAAAASSGSSVSPGKNTPMPVSATLAMRFRRVDVTRRELLEHWLARGVGVHERGPAQRAVRFGRVGGGVRSQPRRREPGRCFEHGRGIVEHRELFGEVEDRTQPRAAALFGLEERNAAEGLRARLDDRSDVAPVVVTEGHGPRRTRTPARPVLLRARRPVWRRTRRAPRRAGDADSGRSDPRATRRRSLRRYASTSAAGSRRAVGGDREVALDDAAGVALVRPRDDVPGGRVEAPEPTRVGVERLHPVVDDQ